MSTPPKIKHKKVLAQHKKSDVEPRETKVHARHPDGGEETVNALRKNVEQVLEQKFKEKVEKLWTRIFSTFQICRALQIPMPKLRELINLGFIAPSIPSKGRGIAAGFTGDDVLGIFILIRLVSLGFSREFAKGFIQGFKGTDAKFLLFNHVGGKKELISHYGEEDLVFEGKSGNIISVKADGKKHSTANWDNAVVLNIAKIRELVATALGGL